jgi:hexosaminidase
VTDVNDMYRRLRVESVRLEALGLTQISQEWASLRMMAGTEEIGPLRVLAAAMEPVSWGDRAHYATEHEITTHAPLDHWVDALRPDPPLRHDFAVMVDAYLKDPRADKAGEMALTDLFASWVQAEPGALELMKHSPLLAEAKARSGQLAQLGRVGVAALGYLSSGETAPAGWKSKQLAVIAEAKRPVALTQFAVLGPLEKLVEAVPEESGSAGK